MGRREEQEFDEEHAAVWRAIDRCARKAGYTPSGMALEIAMDATALNPSKRRYRDGAKRWPSARVLSGVCMVASLSWAEFGAIVDAEIHAERDIAA